MSSIPHSRPIFSEFRRRLALLLHHSRKLPCLALAVLFVGVLAPSLVTGQTADTVYTFEGSDFKLARPLTGTEWDAIAYLLVPGNEPLTFIRAYQPEGKTRVVENDEFSDTAGVKDFQVENRAAIEFAQACLRGEQDIPVTIAIQLVRYSTLSQSFLTSSTLSVLDINLRGEGFKTGRFPAGTDGASMDKFRIKNCDVFSGLAIPADLAKRLVAEASKRLIPAAVSRYSESNLTRPLKLELNLRLVPGDKARNIVNDGFFTPDLKVHQLSRIRNCSVKYGDGTALEPELLNHIKFSKYARTPADEAFEREFGNRIWTGPDGFYFANGGFMLRFSKVSADHREPKELVKMVADGAQRQWFVMSEKLFIIDGTTSLFEGPIDFMMENGRMIMAGIPYQSIEGVVIEGKDVIWNPEKAVASHAKSSVATTPGAVSADPSVDNSGAATGGRTIAVAANGGWVDTGIDLREGQFVILKASGEVIVPEIGLAFIKNKVTPEGLTLEKELKSISPNLVPDETVGALFGRIGETGTPFKVGPEFNLTSTGAGRLFLAANLNPKRAKKSSGSWSVLVIGAN